MTRPKNRSFMRLGGKLLAPAAILLFVIHAHGQTTAFNFQGKLTDAGMPANGTYQFEFRLFDAVSNGTQVGTVISLNSVSVVDGVFSVPLDFGAAAFPGDDRFLEVSVRRNAGETFVTLAPRQQVTATPYSTRSNSTAAADVAANADALGGTAAGFFVQQDIDGNVAITGDLSVNGAASYSTVNAQTQYNLGGLRILDADALQNNLFIGFNSGAANTTGGSNTFVGNNAGAANSIGAFNNFFGNLAGATNTTGSANSFFGDSTGLLNTTGGFNSFFGNSAGVKNTVGSFNSYFGERAGNDGQSGDNNSFFGYNAGLKNTVSGNAFFGYRSGINNTTGNSNAFFGTNSGAANIVGSRNSFYGFESGINNTASDNSFFGNAAGKAVTTGDRNTLIGVFAGENTTTGCCNVFVGNKAGQFNVIGIGNVYLGGSAGLSNTAGNRNVSIGDQSGLGSDNGLANTFIGTLTSGADDLSFATSIGAYASVNTSDTIVLGKVAGPYLGENRPADTVRIPGDLNILGNINVTGTGLVRSVNGLGGDLTLAAGSNITINPAGNTLTISSTAGSVNAILNQTIPQTGASFNIDGNGTVGGTMTANTANVAGNASVGGNASVMGNFGVGTTAPLAKLHVEGGNVLVNSAGTGVILRSPDGNTCRLLTVSDTGAIALTTVTCPQ